MTPAEYMNRSAGFVSPEEFKRLKGAWMVDDETLLTFLGNSIAEQQFARAAMMRDLFDQNEDDATHREWIELNASR